MVGGWVVGGGGWVEVGGKWRGVGAGTCEDQKMVATNRKASSEGK